MSERIKKTSRAKAVKGQPQEVAVAEAASKIGLDERLGQAQALNAVLTARLEALDAGGSDPVTKILVKRALSGAVERAGSAEAQVNDLTHALAAANAENSRLRLMQEALTRDANIRAIRRKQVSQAVLTRVAALVDSVKRLLEGQGLDRDALEEWLKSSGFLDEEFYLRSNPDVLAGKLTAPFHYLKYGAAECRKPSAVFDID